MVNKKGSLVFANGRDRVLLNYLGEGIFLTFDSRLAGPDEGDRHISGACLRFGLFPAAGDYAPVNRLP
jgi:hypothetical protein